MEWGQPHSISNMKIYKQYGEKTEASEVYVDFENLEKESSILWNFHSQAKPLIVKKSSCLYVNYVKK